VLDNDPAFDEWLDELEAEENERRFITSAWD
jgi:hypothetical protein